MNTQQSKALYLASELRAGKWTPNILQNESGLRDRAADELERLHAENEALCAAPAAVAQPVGCGTCQSLARAVMMDQVGFDRKPDGYGISLVTDDESIEKWQDLRTCQETAISEADDMMSTGRGETYEVIALYAAPQPSAQAQDAIRYQFLRDGEWRDTDLESFIRLQLNTLWDAKIDAAIAAKQGGANG